MNTKTINNYNTAIFLEDQEGIDKALEHLTDYYEYSKVYFKENSEL